MTTHRRGSSIGPIDVGDTQGSSLSTGQSSELRHRSRSQSSASAKADKNGNKSGQPARASKGLWLKYLEFARKNTWFTPLLVLIFFYSWYFLSARHDPNHWLNACIAISYPVAGTHDPVLYGKGKKDFAFVAFNVITFTFTREFFMQVLLRPLGYALGVRTRHKLNRFVEQGYSLIYYGVSGPVGLYIMYTSVNGALWYFNIDAFYEDFPHKYHDALFKSFYLLQAAFWAQQALVLTLALEARRRDFHELVFHHVVTIALVFLSYRFHFTYMGLAIFITMDVSDFFLAISKLLNYLDSPLTGVFFAIFTLVWIYMRHWLNLVVLKSILYEFQTVGDFELNWDTQQYKCRLSQVITFALLLALQLVNFYWLVLILRVGYRYLASNGQEAGDVRSEDEDEKDDKDE